jgi:phosphoribosyl 1,2-cyclic phosphodiesterase
LLVESSGGHALLVDAGLSGRKLATELTARGVTPGRLGAVLVSHEHSDHVSGLDVLCRRYKTTVICNQPTLDEVRRRAPKLRYEVLSTGQARTVGSFEVCSFPTNHDAAEPVGYIVEADGARVTVATDLGCTAPGLVEAAEGSDLVVLEANHDVEQLVCGPYPAHLKRRILSERGHLSNIQAADIICNALNTRRQTYWLAHLSRTNNTKEKAREGVTGYLAREGLATTVLVTDRDRPSLVWESHAGAS